MRPRTLIGLMFCTLFLSAPIFAQPSTAQPVIQTAQAAHNDVTIPEGITQEFDAAKGEIKFDGVLTNKGTIIIKSSNPAQAEAILRAAKVVNEGKIISQVPTLTINTERVYGAGEVTAPENISIVAADKDLLIANGTYRAKYFRPSAERKLSINAQRIDAQVDLQAYELSIGVREGNLDIIKQKVDGDPIYYNRGGDITAVMPGNGFDIYVLAAGNITLSGVNAIGLNGEINDFVAFAGLHFANNVDDGNSEFACGGFGGVSCAQTIENNSGPGQIFEGAPGGPFPPSGTITINGAVAKVIWLSARDIVINGTLDARQDNRPAGPSIILEAANSITVNAPLKTSANTIEPSFGSVALVAPTINVNAKITSDAVTIQAFENSVASTGSITTAAIEARRYLDINGGHIQFSEAGGALVGGALLPLSQPHDSGEFTIKTGKLTAHRFINLAATGNIDAGNIELLTNEAEVPLYTHDVRIHANVGKADAPPLKIGGGSNGAASITVQGTTDLGEGLTQKTGAIFLTNGPNGDIVIDGAKLHVTSEHDGTPSLIAYAGTGQVTVKGNIVLDGTATAPAGQILLVGDEIRSTGATLSAKDTLSAPADIPAKVVLATSKLTLAGDLTIEANSKAQTSVRVVPKGSITLDPQDNFPGIYVYVDKFPINVTEGEVLVNGSGGLTIKSKSDEAKVEITAKPLKFNSTGTSQIFATGTGSKINVDYPGSPTAQNSLIFNSGGVTFDTSNPTNDAGDINILADKVRNVALANVSLKANADTNGKGGHITISMDRGTLTLGSEAGAMSLIATGNNADGGTVTINNDVHNGRITYQTEATGPAIDVSALGSDGNGGRIELKADTLTDDGIIAVAAFVGPIDTFVAAGAGSGEGGTFVMGGKNFNFSGRANLPSGPSGKGGNLEIIATQSITLGTPTKSAEFFANGIGNGSGGSIKITPPSGVAVDLSQTRISATGSGTGEGGTVTITEAKGFIDPEHTVQGINVPFVIRVDGGGNRSAGQSYGSISLNGVTCTQWKTSAQPYPKVAWDCITPNTGANIAALVSAGTSLSPTLGLDLAVLVSPEPANQMVGVYAMNNLLDFQTFFAKPKNGPYDKVFGDNHRDWLRVAATFKNSSNGDNATLSGSSTIMVGALVHELGHHLDFIFGPPHNTLSSQTAWTSLGAPDFAFMDSQPCIGVFSQTTCNNNPGKTNSQIFAIRFPGINTADERFAAMFEHVESVLTGNPPSYQSEPELEKALEALPQQKQYMMNIIANPPTPNN